MLFRSEAEKRAEDARHNKAQETQAAQNAAREGVLSPTDAAMLGVPYGTTKAQANGRTAATQQQYTDAGFAERMAAANGQVDDYVKSSANWGVGGISAPTKAWEAAKPNMMKDPVQQKYEQAQRNFVNALLRKESGAAISEAEFDNARKQYFPQPGDDDSAIEQKRQNRLSVIENMSRSAGGAFNTVLMVAPNGVQKRVPAAEVDHYKALGAKVQR